MPPVTLVRTLAAPAPLQAESAPVAGSRARFAYADESLQRDASPPPPVNVPSYAGLPEPITGEFVLIEGVLGHEMRLSWLRVRVQHAAALDPQTEVCLVVGDAEVRVNLAELVSLGCERPLNIAIRRGATVKVILRGSWPCDAGELRIELG